ncbi:MAG TPA: hypothetical protein VM490_01030 [Armatimonadaceae bacterium]|nr:hypothetical protein [Armatimonadaceae bacterium]
MSGMTLNPGYYFARDEFLSDEDFDEGAAPWPPLVPAEPFDLGRNYPLFAILANVLNRHHTAGGANFEYISLPRGLPENLSPELRQFVDLWEDSFRSPSWLLLEELLNFPWQEKVIVREGMVDPHVAHLFGYRRTYFPWPRWQPPRTPRVGFPWAEWPEDIQISYSAIRVEGVTVRWLETYNEAAGDFLEVLEPLRASGDPGNIRLVFWFD